MKTYSIASIPGDGIGKEVVPAGQKVLEALAATSTRFKFEFEDFDWGGDHYRQHGEMMPADGLDQLRDKDAILFGSAGDPHIPDHITLWGLRLKICQGFDQYANVRPTHILPGIDAFKLAQSRPRKQLSVVTKRNAQRHAMVMWDQIAGEIAARRRCHARRRPCRQVEGRRSRPSSRSAWRRSVPSPSATPVTRWPRRSRARPRSSPGW